MLNKELLQSGGTNAVLDLDVGVYLLKMGSGGGGPIGSFTVGFSTASGGVALGSVSPTTVFGCSIKQLCTSGMMNNNQMRQYSSVFAYVADANGNAHKYASVKLTRKDTGVSVTLEESGSGTGSSYSHSAQIVGQVEDIPPLFTFDDEGKVVPLSVEFIGVGGGANPPSLAVNSSRFSIREAA